VTTQTSRLMFWTSKSLERLLSILVAITSQVKALSDTWCLLCHPFSALSFLEQSRAECKPGVIFKSGFLEISIPRSRPRWDCKNCI